MSLLNAKVSSVLFPPMTNLSLKDITKFHKNYSIILETKKYNLDQKR